MQMAAHRFRALILNLALSALVLIFLLLCLRADSLLPLALPDVLQYAAWPFLLAGAFLIGAAEYALIAETGATGAPGDPTRRLIATGIYGWLRNPIYLGGVAVLLGVACAHLSISLIFVSLLLAVCIHILVVRFEEPRAEHRFGKEYLDYRNRTPRWIPKPPGARRA
jgi:protein-S-isoprenylcysteine O-methyltransferase Ste14